MDSSFREQGSDTQQGPKRFLLSLQIPVSLIQWLAGLITMTDEGRAGASGYLSWSPGRRINIGQTPLPCNMNT